MADRFENNDAAETAFDLGIIGGTLTETDLSIEAGDEDWYAFALTATARLGDKATISFNHALGDLDLYLFDSTGEFLLDASYGLAHRESISLAWLPAGSYLLAVDGYDGASNPRYNLSLTATPSTASRDPFEDNDTAATATDLGDIDGTCTATDLSIEAFDEDWYTFKLTSAGRHGDAVVVDFSHFLGDIDIYLYDASGETLLDASYGVANREAISLAGLAAGSYRLLVEGYDGASNPDYQLGVTAAPVTASGDRLENNDSADSATPLQSINGTLTESGLSIETFDEDWFAFTLTAAGRAGDAVTATFNHALGDIDLYLFDDTAETLIDAAYSLADEESISLDGLSAGSYLLQVECYAGASNPDYSLTLNTTNGSTPLPADPWEPNNSADRASALRSLPQTLSGATLTSGDKDWYQFHLDATGTLADNLRIDSRGDALQLRLQDAAGQTIATQTTANGSGQTSISLQGLPAGDYFVQVAGTGTDASGQYTLDIVAGQAHSDDSWTILVYVNGDNNLEDAALDDLNEMEAASIPGNISVGVQIDRMPGWDTSNGNWVDTRRGIVTPDSNAQIVSSPLQSIGEVNMGQTRSLTEFIDWGAANLPAEHYALIIWDHGGGALYGSSWDDSQGGENLSLDEVDQAIRGSSLGRVDLLGFDACLMASIEQAEEASEYASVLVASEKTEPGEGWDYTAFLNALTAASPPTATTLATAIVDSYGSFYGNAELLSAIDLNDLTALNTRIDNFVEVMRSASSTDWSAVDTALSLSWKADAGHDLYVDLGNFMENLIDSSANTQIDSAAQIVVEEIQSVVVRKTGSTGVHGLTVVFPADGSLAGYDAAHYRFLQDTQWDDFLTLYATRSGDLRSVAATASAAPTARAATTLAADFAESLDLSGIARPYSNDTSATALNLGSIGGAFQLTGLSIHRATDVDWFRFVPQADLLAGNAYLSIESDAAPGNLDIALYDSSGQLIRQSNGDGNRETLDLQGLTANQSYSLEVKDLSGATQADYAILFDSTHPSLAADYFESAGGNNSLAKAWLLGTTHQLETLGALRNLSFDDSDKQSGSQGGDWFKVPASRVTQSNANHIVADGVGAAAGDLDLAVYSQDGQLLADSRTANDREEVWFEPQSTDIYIQIVAPGGANNRNYTVQISNELELGYGDSTDNLLAGTAAADYLFGLEGNDELSGLAGDDYLDGGEGIDMARFSRMQQDYAVTKTDDEFSVWNEDEGADRLIHVERLGFRDVNLAFDIDDHAGKVAKLLASVFGADAVHNTLYAGIGLQLIDDGMSYAALAALAIGVTPAKTREAVVSLLWSNLMGSAPTTAQAQPFVDMLNTDLSNVGTLGVLAADYAAVVGVVDLDHLGQVGLAYI